MGWRWSCSPVLVVGGGDILLLKSGQPETMWLSLLIVSIVGLLKQLYRICEHI